MQDNERSPQPGRNVFSDSSQNPPPFYKKVKYCLLYSSSQVEVNAKDQDLKESMLPDL